MHFKLIADYPEEDIECIAISDTAMMFQGYKTTTKYIDLIFEKGKEKKIFIKKEHFDKICKTEEKQK